MGSVFWWVLLVGGFVLVCSRLLLSHFHIRTEARYPMVAAALALLGVGLHSMVDFPLQIASLQLYTAVSCAIAWTVGAKSTEGATGRRRREGNPV